MIPPPSQNTVAVCNHITLLILYYIISRLVILLQGTDAQIQVANISYVTVSFNFINFVLQICLLFVPEVSTSFTLYVIQNIYKVCPSESGTEVGAPLLPAVELCDFPGRWQCMSGEIWYTLDSGSVLLTEAEAR